MIKSKQIQAMIAGGLALAAVGVAALSAPTTRDAILAIRAAETVQAAEAGQISQEDVINRSVILYAGSPLALVRGREVMLDASDGAVSVYVKEGRAMAPLRFVGEQLNVQVNWDTADKEITLKSEGKTVRIQPGSNNIQVNGSSVSLDAPAEISGGRAYVPLRAVTQAMDQAVFYDRGLIILSGASLKLDAARDKGLLDQIVARVNQLPRVQDAETLQKLLESGDQRKMLYSVMDAVAEASPDAGIGGAAPAPAPQVDATIAENQAASDFSSTNVQIQGVDEADTVKTDGSYIYQILPGRVVITLANPPERMEVLCSLPMDTETFDPAEQYVAGDQMIVLGNGYARRAYVRTCAWIYDISDRRTPVRIREIELDGNYVSSRKIGDALYIIANHHAGWYYSGRENASDVTQSVPSYRDSAAGGQDIQKNLNDIRYIPEMTAPNYLLLAGLDLSRPEESVRVGVYLGAGENIYVSQENLYVAVSMSGYENVRPLWRDSAADDSDTEDGAEAVRPGTRILKFSLSGGVITYLAVGQVPGTVLNQFSMDENGGYFRIAVTEDRWDRNSGSRTANHLYVLDETMAIAGSIEDIAPGERIYSARFMGGRAYMVTFKTVDPLFVIDLTNPVQPQILGALKIPGYSQYLHPYDENHLIGFGKDTVEVSTKDSMGRGSSVAAYYLGLKLALFDVSDVTAPKEKFVTGIGDRGSESELLYNHKAFLFNKEKGLLAFPASVAEVPDGAPVDPYNYGAPPYGQFTFQGLYVYHLDVDAGLTLKGRVTHLSGEDMLKAGNGSWDTDKSVQRGLYIGDTLYTLSNKMLKANALSDLTEICGITLP
jgi:uncharacterized secreted protein with C-terminal beta-propeller domain